MQMEDETMRDLVVLSCHAVAQLQLNAGAAQQRLGPPTVARKAYLPRDYHDSRIHQH
jgi:hypothetical protein